MVKNVNFSDSGIKYLFGRRARRCVGVTMLLLSSLGLNASQAAPDARQIMLLTNNCLQCHVNTESTAPIMGVSKDWESVIAQGEEVTLRNVVLGVRGMPPLGYCSACSEQDLRVLTRLVAGFPDAGLQAEVEK
jgi:cytochrome c5